MNCDSVLNNAQCTSLFGQSFIDMISQCGSDGQELAIDLEQDCRMNAAGERCGSIDISDVEDSCLPSSFCSSGCRESLNASVMQNGCCNSNFERLQRYFPLCGIEVPSPCPPTLVNIPSSPPINPSCSTSQDLDTLLRDIQCSSQYAPVLEALNSNNCQDREIEIICNRRDGEFCTDQFRDALFDLSNAVNNCPSTLACPSTCQGAINRLNNNLGCCFNNYNTTYVAGTSFSFSAQPYLTISSNSLWQECGVTPPGACSTQPTPIPTTTPTPSPTSIPGPSPTSIPGPTPSPTSIPGPTPSSALSAAGNRMFFGFSLVLFLISTIVSL